MTVNPIERLDVALPELLAALRPGCLAEQTHQLDTFDAAFARLACEHGDRCSSESDYPGWTPGGTR